MQLQELASRARKAFLLRDWTTAEQFARKMREMKPDHPGILLFLGNIYTKMGRYNMATQAYQESLELDSKNPEAYNNIGIVYRLEENLPAAVGALERAKELAPERADVWYNLANVYKQMDEPEEAETYYRKALEINPGFTRAYNNLGNLYEATGRHSRAEELYRNGLEMDPNNPTLRYNLGITYQAEERFPEAIESYRHALRSRPNWVDGLNNLGILLERSGKFDEAARVLESALKIEEDNPKLNNNMGVVLGALGRHEEALNYIDRAIRKDPHYTTAQLNRSTELEELTDYEAAWDHLQKLKKESPANLDIREKIARLAVRTSRTRQAKEEIRFILDHNPKAGFAYSLLGSLYLQTGDRPRAAQAFQRAISLNRDDLETALKLALLYKEIKEYEQAIAQVSGILARKPEHRGARLLLAKLYLYENLYSESISILSPLYEDYPYDEELLETLIRAHRGAGNREEALRYTEELVNLQGERDSTLDLDKLEQTLTLYEETVEAYAEEHERKWEENLKKLFGQEEPEVEPEEIKEEESLFFDSIPDLDQPAKILDVGGIEPVIVINEDEERLSLREMEEEIPPLPPEEEEDEEEPPQTTFSEVHMRPPEAAGGEPATPSAGSGGSAGSGSGQQAPAVRQQSEPVHVHIENPSPSRLEMGGSLNIISTRGLQEKVRNRLPAQEPEPPQAPPQEAEPPAAATEEDPAGLLKYLEDLTEFLPEERRMAFEQSEMRLRIEALRDRLEGRPSLRKQLARFESREEQTEEDLTLNPGSIESTLSFMGNLSTYLPDSKIGIALHHRIADILKTMKREEDGDS